MEHPDAENTDRLTPRQTLAVPIVAVSPSIAAGAKAAGISRTTLNRWMLDPAFRAEVESARKDAAALAYSELQALALKSVAALSSLLEHDNPKIRAQAVRTALNTIRKAEIDRELRRRVEVLGNALDLLTAPQ